MAGNGDIGGTKKQGGSTQEAQAMAGMVPPEMPERQVWSPGKYVLTEGKYQPVTGGPDLQRGDIVEISKESDATRLGNAGVLAPVDSIEARRAQARDDRARDQVRLEELRAEQMRLQEKIENDED